MLSARPVTTLRRVAERTPIPRPGPLARARAAVGRFGFLIVLVVAVSGGIALGVHQGRDEQETGFDEPTTSAPPPGPFQSEQDSARGQPAKDVFAHTCGTCHTLRRANVRGIIGPDLDKLPQYAKQANQPLKEFVATSIAHPEAYIQPGYPKNVMPKSYGALPAQDLKDLVDFLTAPQG